MTPNIYTQSHIRKNKKHSNQNIKFGEKGQEGIRCQYKYKRWKEQS